MTARWFAPKNANVVEAGLTVDDQSPLEVLRDVFVHMPIGALLIARDELENFYARAVSRGRSERTAAETGVRNQVEIARSVGRARVRKAVRRAGEFGGSAQNGSANASNKVLSSRGFSDRSELSRSTSGRQLIRQAQADMGLRLARSTNSNTSKLLPIEDYDSLSAAQIRQLLVGLDRNELAAIRDYELSHRGRKTILTRIDEALAR